MEAIASGWTKNTLAVDHENNSCPPESDAACKWCEYGAVLAVTKSRELPETVSNYIMDLLNMANPGKQNEEYASSEGDFWVTFKYNDSIRTEHEEAVARFANTEKFLRDNPQFAVMPKYEMRTFARDD